MPVPERDPLTAKESNTSRGVGSPLMKKCSKGLCARESL